MARRVMIFCDFCGRGFEVEKSIAETARKATQAAGSDRDEPLLCCGECAENLRLLDESGGNDLNDGNSANGGRAVEYFTRHLMNGVTLKNAYRELMKRRTFSITVSSYALRMKAVNFQRQDGKKGVVLTFAPQKGANPLMTVPPIFFGVDTARSTEIRFDAPYYYGGKEKSRKKN
ncbi:MAG: hypothetical protein LBP79_01825 [Clostridiales bacterium]|jgi:hypothetical protein|nr:hypothetical protein [Clostridiales bacterium]